MPKRNLTLYVDTHLIDLAKAKDLNISQLLESVLKSYFKEDTDIKQNVSIQQIEKKETEALTELNKIRAIKEQLKKDVLHTQEMEIEDG